MVKYYSACISVAKILSAQVYESRSHKAVLQFCEPILQGIEILPILYEV